MKLLLALLTLSLFSCSRLDRVRECKALVKTVNEGLDGIEQMSKGGNSPERFEKLSAEYRKLAGRVQALPVAQGKAKTEIKEYTELLRSTADALKNAANAERTGAPPETYQRELERLTRRERINVSKLDTFCHSP